MKEMQSMILAGRAEKLLAEADTIQKAKELRDKALTAADYARHMGLREDVRRYARSIAWRAMRRIGELWVATPKDKGGRPKKTGGLMPPVSRSACERLGLTKAVAKEALRFSRLPGEMFEDVLADKMTLSRALRLLRDQAAEKNRRAEASVTLSGMPDADIREGDFRTVLADLKDVDAIITDPPYKKEFLPLLKDLALWADKVLRSDGVLAVMFGQTYLPEVYALLEGGRPYRWTLAILTAGPGYVSHARKVQSNWKPVLLYGGGPRTGDLIHVKPEGAEQAKAQHRWGQNLAGFDELVKRLTKPGQLVCDPFIGGGTTLLAARLLGRRTVGCDVDPKAVTIARERCA